MEPTGSLLFVETSVFSRRARELGLEEALHDLQNQLIAEPRLGSIDPGTGGLRKVRISLPGGGKRGGARVLYFYFAERATIYFVLAYAKNAQSSLSPEERESARRLVTMIISEQKRKG